MEEDMAKKVRDDAQLGGQDKRDSLRLCPAVGLSLRFKAFTQAAICIAQPFARGKSLRRRINFHLAYA